MTLKAPISSSLKGHKIALPESRQLDVLAAMCERRGASVVRIPLVTILDTPHTDAVAGWLASFIAEPPDYLVILTGEGIRRLRRFAERTGCLDGFVAALNSTVKVCRGPKPGRALKEVGLKPDLLGTQPTTRGIIATLDGLDLGGKRVAVQLYGEDPNQLLMDYLDQRGASALPVAPYVYAAESDERRVRELIDQMLNGQITLIAFTSQPQYVRLRDVARAAGAEPKLLQGLARTVVAAVGPVVADQLSRNGVRVDITPRGSYFMKPMVRAMERFLSVRRAAGGV